MEQAVVDIVSRFPVVGVVLMCLGALVMLAQFVVMLTKTKKDDEVLEKIEGNSIGKAILDLLKSFAPFQKKPEGTLVSSAKAVK